MTVLMWQDMTCLPAVLCEACGDVALAGADLCRLCKPKIEAEAQELALQLVAADFEVDRFLASIRGVG